MPKIKLIFVYTLSHNSISFTPKDNTENFRGMSEQANFSKNKVGTNTCYDNKIQKEGKYCLPVLPIPSQEYNSTENLGFTFTVLGNFMKTYSPHEFSIRKCA